MKEYQYKLEYIAVAKGLVEKLETSGFNVCKTFKRYIDSGNISRYPVLVIKDKKVWGRSMEVTGKPDVETLGIKGILDIIKETKKDTKEIKSETYSKAITLKEGEPLLKSGSKLPFVLGEGLAPEGLQGKCIAVYSSYKAVLIKDFAGVDIIYFEEK